MTRGLLPVLAITVVLAGPVSAQDVAGGVENAAADVQLYRLSQEHASAQRPMAAREAIERAIALRPDNRDYLQAAATLCTWLGDYRSARAYYSRLLVLHPNDRELWLSLGRVLAWMGEVDDAAAALRRYVASRPDASEAWLELARVESWRGRFDAALDALATYRSHAGESRDYVATLARVLTAAGRPRTAAKLVAPWRLRAPDYGLTLAHALALGMSERPRAAREALAAAGRLDGVSPETRDAARAIRAAIGSSIEPQFTASADSDHLQYVRIGSRATLVLPDATRLSVGYERAELRASAGGGLGRVAGDGRVSRIAGWAELMQPVGEIELVARIGSSAALGTTSPEYAVGVRLRRDTLTLDAARSGGAFAASPRSLELSLTTTRHSMKADWSPRLDLHVVAEADIQKLSDGNTRWDATLAPRQGVVRREHFNMDVGVTAYRLQTAHDLLNGYYDPSSYESYAAVAYPYWKASDDIGVGATVALGIQRQAGLPLQGGAQLAVESTIGIYRAWRLTASVAVTNNRRSESGAYRGESGVVTLARRF